MKLIATMISSAFISTSYGMKPRSFRRRLAHGEPEEKEVDLRKAAEEYHREKNRAKCTTAVGEYPLTSPTPDGAGLFTAWWINQDPQEVEINWSKKIPEDNILGWETKTGTVEFTGYHDGHKGEVNRPLPYIWRDGGDDAYFLSMTLTESNKTTTDLKLMFRKRYQRRRFLEQFMVNWKGKDCRAEEIYDKILQNSDDDLKAVFLKDGFKKFQELSLKQNDQSGRDRLFENYRAVNPIGPIDPSVANRKHLSIEEIIKLIMGSGFNKDDFSPDLYKFVDLNGDGTKHAMGFFRNGIHPMRDCLTMSKRELTMLYHQRMRPLSLTWQMSSLSGNLNEGHFCCRDFSTVFSAVCRQEQIYAKGAPAQFGVGEVMLWQPKWKQLADGSWEKDFANLGCHMMNIVLIHEEKDDKYDATKAIQVCLLEPQSGTIYTFEEAEAEGYKKLEFVSF